MAARVGSIEVGFTADMRSYGAALRDGEKRTERFSKRARRSVSQLGTTIARVGSISATALTAGVVAGTAGLAALTKNAIKTADEIGKTAKSIGVTAEQLQELRYAANRSGIETGKLDQSMLAFTKRLGEAMQGTGEAKDALKELGISLDDIRGKAPLDVLDMVADKLKGIEDPLRRNAILSDLFSRQGIRMGVLLQQGSAGIQSLRDRARDLGVVISNDMIRRAEAANDQLDDMADVFKVAGTNLALEFMPVMRELANLATSPEFISGVRSLSGELSGMVHSLIDNGDEVIRVAGAIAGLQLGAKLGRIGGGYGALGGAALGGLAGYFSPELYKALQDQSPAEQMETLRKKAHDLNAEIDDLTSKRPEGDTLADQIRGDTLDKWIDQKKTQVEAIQKTLAEMESGQAGGTGSGGRFVPEAQIPTGTEIEPGTGNRFTPPPPSTKPSSGGRTTTTKAIKDETSAADRLVSSLKEELRLVGATAEERAVSNNLRQAGVDLTTTQGQRIADLTKRLIEAQQAEFEAAQEAQFFGDLTYGAFSDLISGASSFEDAMRRVGNAIADAALQAALLGQGPLAGLFGTSSSGSGPGGLIGSIFSAFGGGSDPWAGLRVPTNHVGGDAGRSSTYRNVSPADVAGASVFHTGKSGVKHGEVMALLEDTESVFTGAQTGRIANALSGAASLGAGRKNVMEVHLSGDLVGRILEEAEGQSVRITNAGIKDYDKGSLKRTANNVMEARKRRFLR